MAPNAHQIFNRERQQSVLKQGTKKVRKKRPAGPKHPAISVFSVQNLDRSGIPRRFRHMGNIEEVDAISDRHSSSSDVRGCVKPQ